MLTEQQLNDAVECENRKMSCRECSCNTNPSGIIDCKVAGEGAKTALYYKEKYDKAMDMLRKLEFSNITWDGQECFICNGRNEHENGCELAALLKEGE